MTPVLEVTGLRFGFDSGGEVLRGVTFSLQAGECLGIVGANGSGKSTLLWCLLGLLRAEGGVRLFGEPLSRRHRHRLGMVFQNPEDQLFMPKLFEDVALPLLNRGVPPEEAAARARDALAAADLAGRENRPASALSLGQRKRAAIAAALAASPELLVLDEPTAELDGRSVHRLAEVLARLPVARLIASHDLRFLEGLCSRLLVLDEGVVVADGPGASILADHDLLVRVGLL